MNQVRKDRYELWNTSEDKRFPSPKETYKNHFWTSQTIINDDYILNVFSDYVKPLMKDIHGDNMGEILHQATRMKNNGKDYFRCHYDDYMGTIGYILYFTKHHWKYDWGGLLQISTNQKVETIYPDPNRLVLINHKLKTAHWINPIQKYAKQYRNSMTGFAVSSDKELPKTWTHRL